MSARRSKRRKSPVLTSPWKIGLFVALMLLVTGFGVGYYLARIYGINPTWLRPDTSRWIIDSYEFFREMYPLAAGVVVIALSSYFAIASAVRRYRHYLDSGQDYRRMISLAGSIDDLTNPAQIARLSRFPELQNVLRNYGDQIREISEQLDDRQSENRPADLEAEIDSVLGGNPVTETLAEDTWWTPVVRKVEAALRASAQASSGAAGRWDETRQAASRAALACGRVMESAAGASEDIIEIITAAGRLGESVRDCGRPAGAASAPVSGAPVGAKIETIMLAVQDLEQSGREMYRFSEESNGQALTIALMAARGNANEHDLAQCAEKVRMTAEQFGKLGRRLEDLSKSLAEGCRSIISQADGAAAPGATQGNVPDIISALAGRIEQRSGTLQNRLIALGNDVEDIGSALRSVGADVPQTAVAGAPGDGPAAAAETPAAGEDMLAATVEAPGAAETPSTAATPYQQCDGQTRDTGMIVNFGAGSEAASVEDEEQLVIDRSGPGEISNPRNDSFWETDTTTAARQAEQQAETRAAEEALQSTRRGGDAGVRDDAADTANQDSAAGYVGAVNAGVEDTAAEAAAARPAPAGAAAGAEDVQARPADVEPARARGNSAADADKDEEPIYDLFELGAVECVEEAGKIL